MSLEPASTEKDPPKNIQNEEAGKITPKRSNPAEDNGYLIRIYWAFIKKKQLKFKHQYPRMGQNQITSKIIRQWQALSMDQKIKLGQSYNLKQISHSDDDNRSSFSLDSRSEEHKISDNDLNKKGTAVKQPKQDQNILQRDSTGAKPHDIKLNIEDSESQPSKQQIKDEESDSNSISESSSVQKQTSKSRVKNQIGVKAKKPIRKKTKSTKKPEDLIKLQNGEYLLFYKHYFDRLKGQHPKWSSIQINHIIKLLWKKKQQQQKKLKLQAAKKEQTTAKNHGRTKPRKAISGQQYFVSEKKMQGLTKEQIDFLWKQLPRESKNDWNKRATMLVGIPEQKKSQFQANTKTEGSIKTQSGSKTNKSIISFRDILLKGGLPREEGIKPILEEKEQGANKQSLKTQKKPIKTQLEANESKKQAYEYILLSSNPFSFMKNKITLEKIILE